MELDRDEVVQLGDDVRENFLVFQFGFQSCGIVEIYAGGAREIESVVHRGENPGLVADHELLAEVHGLDLIVVNRACRSGCGRCFCWSPSRPVGGVVLHGDPL